MSRTPKPDERSQLLSGAPHSGSSTSVYRKGRALKFDAFHDYYLGSREEDIYLVSVDAGTEVEEPYDKLEAITMREAMEFYATFVKGWRSKDQRPPRQKNPDSIFPLWLAYNFRLLSKAVGNFISKGN